MKLFTQNGISYVVFKGPVLADVYKSSAKRFSKDLDILVLEESREEAEKILKNYPMQYDETDSKECVSVWESIDGLQIELHTYLWEDYEGEQVEKLKEMHLAEPQSLVNLESSIGSIVTMGHTQHLVYQMFHTIKHLLFKGIALRVFIDTTLFINQYIEEIDVNFFWLCMDKLKYTNFCLDMFCVCEEYFNLDSRIFPKDRPVPKNSTKFMNQIMTVCLRNIHDPVYNTASNAVFHTYLKDNEASDKNDSPKLAHSNVIVKLLFPSRDFLTERYAYAKKYSILLPIAWIHRALYKLFFDKGDNGGLENMQKSFSITRQRTIMLQEYKLID